MKNNYVKLKKHTKNNVQSSWAQTHKVIEYGSEGHTLKLQEYKLTKGEE